MRGISPKKAISHQTNNEFNGVPTAVSGLAVRYSGVGVGVGVSIQCQYAIAGPFIHDLKPLPTVLGLFSIHMYT